MLKHLKIKSHGIILSFVKKMGQLNQGSIMEAVVDVVESLIYGDPCQGDGTGRFAWGAARPTLNKAACFSKND